MILRNTWKSVFLILIFSFASLSHAQNPAETAFGHSLPSVNCALIKETLSLRNRKVELPRPGLFVTESHYATQVDRFGTDQRLFPKSGVEEIDSHLQRSCRLLREVYGFNLSDLCGEIYDDSWDREWTPPENGKAGQTARGSLRPEVFQELWQGNFMYASGAMPSPGTKYLVTNPKTGVSVVVSFGYEIGPRSSRWLGGLTPEVQWALGNLDQNTTLLYIGRAQDQSIPYGPVKCNRWVP